MNDRILRVREVEKITGKTRQGIYIAMKRGEFPKSVKIGTRAIGWKESAIQEWIKSLE